MAYTTTEFRYEPFQDENQYILDSGFWTLFES